MHSPPVGLDAVAALRSELEHERARRRAIEGELHGFASRLAALQRELRQIETTLTDGGRRTAVVEKPVQPERSSKRIELPREFAETGPSYWLRRCEGFQVLAGTKSLGTVEEVRFGRRHDRPDTLIVSGAGRRSRVLLVPVELVAEIRQADELITLSADPREPQHGLRGKLAGAITRRAHRPRAEPEAG
jgi:hypothetical protein